MPFECCPWSMNYHSILATSSSLVGALITCNSAKDFLVDSGCANHELSSTLLCVGFTNSSVQIQPFDHAELTVKLTSKAKKVENICWDPNSV